MRLFRVALLLGAALSPAATVAQTAAPAATVKPIAFTERTLANGLRVYALHDTKTSNVAVQVWYDVGSKETLEEANRIFSQHRTQAEG